MSMVARAVQRFLETPRPGIKRIDLQQWFERETGIEIDYSYFCVLVKKFGRKRTVRTGMVDCRLGDLPQVFLERAMWGICAKTSLPWTRSHGCCGESRLPVTGLGKASRRRSHTNRCTNC
jgi:hypothetical protein